MSILDRVGPQTSFDASAYVWFGVIAFGVGFWLGAIVMWMAGR